MMTLVQKIRWSGSVFKAVFPLVAAALYLGSLAACSHVPKESTSGDDRDGPVKRSPDKGSIHFSVFAPGADGVKLILMRSNSLTPAAFEVQARVSDNGSWSASLDLIPGEYRYFFLVDGAVTVNEEKGRIEQDDFGGVTGVLTVHQTPEGELKAF